MVAHRRGAARTIGVLLAALAVAGCGSSGTSTSTTGGPSTTGGTTTTVAATSTTAGTTSTSAATTSSGSSTTAARLEQPAVFPAASVHFATPDEAAKAFVTQVLKVPVNIGPFQAGDARSGEINVYGAQGQSTATVRSVLLMRQLGPANSWYVLAAVSDAETIAAPTSQATVKAGKVQVSGSGRGFEGVVIIQALAVADPPTVLDRQTAMGGSFEQPEPVSVTLDLSKATPGQTVLLLMQASVGNENDPGSFSAIPVVVSG